MKALELFRPIQALKRHDFNSLSRYTSVNSFFERTRRRVYSELILIFFKQVHVATLEEIDTAMVNGEMK